MIVHIELFNSQSCLLDTHIVRVGDGEDVDIALTRAVALFVAKTALSVGDTIKISEVS